MTAISAPQSAREGANPFPPTATAHIRIPGSARTYEVREVLRGMGLRWDPVSHAWHGTLPAEKGALLGKQLGLRPQVVPTIEMFAPEPRSEPVAAPPRPPTRPPVLTRPHDSSRTRAEARLAYREHDEDADEFATPTRRFSVWEATSGLPDDSREEDERAGALRLLDLCARVKHARAEIARTPRLAELLASDRGRAGMFYSQYRVTEAMLRHGVRDLAGDEDDNPLEQLHSHGCPRPELVPEV
jgi:hypothetical protein